MMAARQALAAQPGQVGALVYVAGRWVGLDLLADPGLAPGPGLAQVMWPMPLGRGRSLGTGWTPALSCRRWALGQAEPAPAVGLGEEYRLLSPGLAGATLVAHGRVAHLMAFPVAEALQGPEVNQ